MISVTFVPNLNFIKMPLVEVNIYHAAINNGGPFEFYTGSASDIVAIHKKSDTEAMASAFPFTNKTWQAIWAGSYHRNIEPAISAMTVGKSILWDLRGQYEITMEDHFSPLFSPSRTEKNIFINLMDTRTDPKFYLFSKRPIHTVEDCTAFESANYYSQRNGNSVQIPTLSEQSPTGRLLMMYLYEARFIATKVPRYLDRTTMEMLSKTVSFFCDTDNLFDFASGHFGKSLKRIQEELMSPFGYLIDEGLEEVVNTGTVTITQLLELGVDSVLNHLETLGNVFKINIVQDSMYDTIKEVYFKDGKICVVPSFKSKNEDFLSVFDTDNLEIVSS